MAALIAEEEAYHAEVVETLRRAFGSPSAPGAHLSESNASGVAHDIGLIAALKLLLGLRRALPGREGSVYR